MWNYGCILKLLELNFITISAATKGSSQPAPTTGSDNEGTHPARRRRWGASTATTQKKPSISISTESLKVISL